MKLGVVVGHMNSAMGANLAKPYDFISEYEYNQLLAAHIILEAKAKFITVSVAFRDSVGIEGAYKQIQKDNCDACVELHFNSFNAKAEGTETLYGSLPNAKSWADALQSEMVSCFARVGSANRGTKFMSRGERGGANVNQPIGIPCALIEPFFGDTRFEAEMALLKQRDLAKAIIQAFLTFTKSA